ncbi:MAG: hypothetical protein AAGK14_13400 [Verrucomicrobiota bacterium]
MTSTPESTPSLSGGPSSSPMSHWYDTITRRLSLWMVLYLLVLPTIISLGVFSYYPKFDVVRMSMFRWNPPAVQEFTFLQNFVIAFSDPLFWSSFQLVFILFVANLFKLWPGIFAAIALHRLTSNRWRYFYQVMFVVPMIIPAMVWLLIWKSFYEPDTGLLNSFLNATGLMSLLRGMDSVMPAIAQSLDPVLVYFVNPVFGGMGGLVFLGFLLVAASFWRDHGSNRLPAFGFITALATMPAITFMTPLAGSFPGGLTAAGIVVALAVGLAWQLGDRWISWPFLLIAGTAVFWGELWRLPVVVAIALGAYWIIHGRSEWVLSSPRLRNVGLGSIVVGCLLVAFGAIWTEPTNQFNYGTPAWLGSKDLIIPALILWGFPWVGTVGVLIYLSGLQNISNDVYEAAELDGVSPLGMIWHIELPLILTQVRINLIFMTINTLTAYEIYYILLGPSGGPGNRGMVPGLYMFSSAFSEGKFGYACALGMVLFVVILTLTIVYQRYIKVDK